MNIGSDFTCTGPLHFSVEKKIIVLSCPDTCTQLFSAATSSKCILVEDLGWTHRHTNQSFSAPTFLLIPRSFLAHRSASVSVWWTAAHLHVCPGRFNEREFTVQLRCAANRSVIVLWIPKIVLSPYFTIVHYWNLSDWHFHTQMCQTCKRCMRRSTSITVCMPPTVWNGAHALESTCGVSRCAATSHPSSSIVMGMAWGEVLVVLYTKVIVSSLDLCKYYIIGQVWVSLKWNQTNGYQASVGSSSGDE